MSWAHGRRLCHEGGTALPTERPGAAPAGCFWSGKFSLLLVVGDWQALIRKQVDRLYSEAAV
jgi:hypothetical protein